MMSESLPDASPSRADLPSHTASLAATSHVFDWQKAAKERYDRALKAAQERSAEFYANNEPTTVREIDWPYPPCPVCDLDLEHDEGWWCDVCCVYWSENGTSARRDLELVADRASAPPSPPQETEP